MLRPGWSPPRAPWPCQGVCLDWDSGEAACLRGGLCISESGTWTRGGKKRRGSWEKGLEGASLGPGGLGSELSVMRQKWGA